jgi:hypothetical protein
MVDLRKPVVAEDEDRRRLEPPEAGERVEEPPEQGVHVDQRPARRHIIRAFTFTSLK